MRFDAEQLVVADASGAPMEIPLADVARLELRTGERRNMSKGSLIGAGVGIAVGGVAGAIEGSRCEGEFLCFGAGGGAAMGAVALGGLGSIVGLLIGAMVTTERWSDVSSDRWSIAVQPAPVGFARGGVEVGFRIGM